jgi:hypothetical protein
MRGTIEQVWENEGKKGQKYLTVEIGGERYNVWDDKYFASIRPGASIEYEFRKSGNFRHITGLSPIDNHPPGPQPTESHHPPAPDVNYKDRQITRLSCLKSASEILAPVQIDVGAKRELVIETARYFERYVRDNDVGSLDQNKQGGSRAGNGQ